MNLFPNLEKKGFDSAFKVAYSLSFMSRFNNNLDFSMNSTLLEFEENIITTIKSEYVNLAIISFIIPIFIIFYIASLWFPQSVEIAYLLFITITAQSSLIFYTKKVLKINKLFFMLKIYKRGINSFIVEILTTTIFYLFFSKIIAFLLSDKILKVFAIILFILETVIFAKINAIYSISIGVKKGCLKGIQQGTADRILILENDS